MMMFLDHRIKKFASRCAVPLIFFLVSSNISIAQKSRNKSTSRSNVKQSDSLLIKNVYLISREDSVGDVLINVLVIDKQLELITRDDVLFGRDVRTLDGNKGFLMGNIALGKAPSFIILDENPRKDFDIFLNTSAHTTFAMNQGVIVKNNLKPLAVNLQKEPRRLSWSSYQPPPMAVPINYYNSRKWNKFDTKVISGLFNGVLALDRLRWITQNQNSKIQVGDLNESSIGAIRAIRFGLIGTINFKKPWVYTLFFTNKSFDRGFDATNDNGLTLYDLRVDIPLPQKINLSVGKQKEPISMERLMALMFLPMQERQAAADAFLPARNYGVLINGIAFNNRATWAAGIFKNFIDSDTSFSATPTQITARVTTLPYLSQDASNLLHLGLCLRYSTNNLPLNIKADAEFFQAPTFASVEALNAEHFLTYLLEIYWRKGPILLGGEFIGNQLSSSTQGNSHPGGWNVTASWVVTGEMRSYRTRSGIFDPVPVSKPVGVGGYGALEITSRYSAINLSNGPLDGGIMRTVSFGANWWLSAKVQFGADYRLITLDKQNTKGNSSGLNIRLMLILE
jgi:phosphate-selective porin OprO/OprP